MPNIKIKNVAKGTIKTIDKTAIISGRMKNSFVRTKDKAEEELLPDDNSPVEYAVNRVSNAADKGAHKSPHVAAGLGKYGVKGTKAGFSKLKRNLQDQSTRQVKKQVRQLIDKSRTSIKTIDRGNKTVKSTVKGTVKTAQKTIKTAEHTAKASVKTAKQAAKVAQKTAQATARAAKMAAQAARATAKATITALKAAIKAIMLAAKAIIAATKALIAAIAAGGWVAVIIILVICLIALIIGSCYGIFFSGEDTGNGMTVQTAVQEINSDYQERLEEIKSANSYDILEMSGSRAVWKEVLSVYAVKTTGDPMGAQEVATMDEEKKNLLKNIFWEMNQISYDTESKTETVIIENDDGHGNILEEEIIVTRVYLYISVSHKTVDEMAEKYNFNSTQRGQLRQLLMEENDPLWSQVLYGIGNNDIVAVALSQVGNIGGEPYWSWYGFSNRVEWCACFVSWCADQCGYIESGVLPKFSGCTSQGVPWFKERGQWQDNTYIPNPGDIIFFNWDGDSLIDHVGIVEKVENGKIYTIEGNSNDSCVQNSYPLGYSKIYGFGIPLY